MSTFPWKLYVTISELHTFTASSEEEQECLDRIFISRAYYGVFCQLRDLLIRASIIKPTKKSDIHQIVINKLQSAKNSRMLQQVSKDLERLRTKRNDADYESKNIKNSNSTRSFCIQMAQSIQERIDNDEIWNEIGEIPLN